MEDAGNLARASLSLFIPGVGAHKQKEQELKKAQLEKLYASKLNSKKAILVVRADGEPEVTWTLYLLLQICHFMCRTSCKESPWGCFGLSGSLAVVQHVLHAWLWWLSWRKAEAPLCLKSCRYLSSSTSARWHLSGEHCWSRSCRGRARAGSCCAKCESALTSR
jgi:hypothetical protein